MLMGFMYGPGSPKPLYNNKSSLEIVDYRLQIKNYNPLPKQE